MPSGPINVPDGWSLVPASFNWSLTIMGKARRIDFTNPNALLNNGKRIPIATPAQFHTVKAEVRRRFETRVGEGPLNHETAHFSNDDADQLASRVLGGLTAEQIYEETEKELHRRFPVRS